MSNPNPNFDPENIKEEDNTDYDLEAKQARMDEEERNKKEMDDYFTREPHNFGGGGGW